MKIQKPRRPLINRPRYVTKPPKAVTVKPSNNKFVNKKNLNKQQEIKVVNKEILEQQMQEKQMKQPVSGSVNLVGEDIKNKPPTKSRPPLKRKTKQLHKPSRRIEKPAKNKDGVFKQMKNKFIGKSKDEGVNNKDN